jgi:hypothetical protein
VPLTFEPPTSYLDVQDAISLELVNYKWRLICEVIAGDASTYEYHGMKFCFQFGHISHGVKAEHSNS